jgi:hypothetical protein
VPAAAVKKGQLNASPTADTRARIIQQFEKHRMTPGTPYEESRFLDFLLANPNSRNAVRNSFRGLRRLNAFLDEVQLEFGVCFSIQDREANYPLDKFVVRTLDLQQSRRGSLRSLDNQIKSGAGWQPLVVADIVLLAIAAFVGNNVWVLSVVGAIAVAINIWFVWFIWRARSYLLKLRARLEGD